MRAGLSNPFGLPDYLDEDQIPLTSRTPQQTAVDQALTGATPLQNAPPSGLGSPYPQGGPSTSPVEVPSASSEPPLFSDDPSERLPYQTGARYHPSNLEGPEAAEPEEPGGGGTDVGGGGTGATPPSTGTPPGVTPPTSTNPAGYDIPQQYPQRRVNPNPPPAVFKQNPYNSTDHPQQDNAFTMLSRWYWNYLGREMGPDEFLIHTKGGTDFSTRQLDIAHESIRTSDESKAYFKAQGGKYADELQGTTTSGGDTGTGSSSASGYQRQGEFTGFDFQRGQDPSKSAKDAFASLAQAATDPMPRDKASATAWFQKWIAPGLEKLGYKVHWVDGDKAMISTRENPNGEEIDWIRGLGGGAEAFAWQTAGPGGWDAPAGGGWGNYSSDGAGMFGSAASGFAQGSGAYSYAMQVLMKLMQENGLAQALLGGGNTQPVRTDVPLDTSTSRG
jgi:hypothetical protein